MKQRALIVLFLLLGWGAASAQRIEITDKGLKINSVRINRNTTPQRLRGILGQPDRITKKYHEVWTYDEKGMMVYIDQDNQEFSIILCYKPTQYDYAPASRYPNIIKIFDNIITPATTIEELQEIPEIIFADRKTGGNYIATVSGVKLIIEAYSGRIESIELSLL